MRSIFTGFLLLGFTASASAAVQMFTTGFELADQRTNGTFTEEVAPLATTFAGGTAFTVGKGSLYHSGSKSWMIDPQGDFGRGNSSGTGEVTFSHNAFKVSGFVRAEAPNADGRLELITSDNTVHSSVAIRTDEWTELSVDLGADSAVTFSGMRLVNVGQEGWVVLDDLAWSAEVADNSGSDMTDMDTTDQPNDNDADTGDGGSSGGGAAVWLGLLLLAARLRRRS